MKKVIGSTVDQKGNFKFIYQEESKVRKQTKTKQLDIRKAFNKLPYEAQQSIENVYCVDQNKEIKDLTIQEMIKEVKWTIERMKMDLNEYDEDEYDYQTAEKTLKECKKWLIMFKGN